MRGSRWTSANAVRVRGFGVHQAEALAVCKRAAGPLQMLCLSADLLCVKLKRWLGARKQLDRCKCCACQWIWCRSTWTSANAAPVSGFGVHQVETLARCKEAAGPLQTLCLSGYLVCIQLKRWLGARKRLQLCKCCACQRIWCT